MVDSKRWFVPAAAAAMIAAGAGGAGIALGQQAIQRPTENQGVAQQILATLDLGPEIQGLHGRALRMRVVTIEPGGRFAYHDHKDRPAMVYLLQGTSIEYFGDGSTKPFREGEGYAEGKNSSHWGENKDQKPLKLLVVDIVKQP